MSLHYAFDQSKKTEQSTSTHRQVTFEFNPAHLMCFKNCARIVTGILAGIGIEAEQIKFNINVNEGIHLMSVNLQNHISEQTVIDTLASAPEKSREARVYRPRTKATYGF